MFNITFLRRPADWIKFTTLSIGILTSNSIIMTNENMNHTRNCQQKVIKFICLLMFFFFFHELFNTTQAKLGSWVSPEMHFHARYVNNLILSFSTLPGCAYCFYILLQFQTVIQTESISNFRHVTLFLLLSLILFWRVEKEMRNKFLYVNVHDVI